MKMLQVESFPIIGGVNNNKSSFYRYSNNEKAGKHATKMPVDFAAYLMSSSPPLGFSGFNITDHFCDVGRNSFEYSSFCETVSESALRPIIAKANNEWNSYIYDDDENEEKVESISKKTGLPKKTVSFADCKGFSLTKVRYMTEQSDTPPKLENCPHMALIIQRAEDQSFVPPAIVLDFPQPASDYLSFRQKLDTNCVCLENVIAKEYNLAGTVKVKNIAFEKSVFVRWTCDGWQSFADIQTDFLTTGDSSPTVYDTFGFELIVPENLTSDDAVEFAVCYECNGNQYWDNRGGTNYRVSIKKQEEKKAATIPQYTSSFKPNYDGISTWTEYACWTHMDSGVPYY
ncbi:protein phosphatase 1 regulatory subunit 3B-like [Tubulanus polymorphus]|uniref:protein phosphatase 1 regulatory subunit 3B-like n=1 Tax=Tubulanus polymorphus TaxID=672921 RepID=UPI003DA3137D